MDGKGVSKSSMPYKKVPPRSLTNDSSEVTKLSKEGFKPSQIGVILRDNYTIPQSRFIIGSKIWRKGIAPKVSENRLKKVKEI